jgi:hypothetical protein
MSALRALAVAAAAGLVSLAAPSASAAPTTTTTDTAVVTTTDPAAAAAGWLARQFSDAHNKRVPAGDHIELSFDAGSGPVFFFDGGTTIDAAFALAATHSGKRKIDVATHYVATHLDEYVDYSGKQGGPFFGSVGKAALAAIVDGRNPNSFGGHHLISELKQDECPAGSTSCTPGSNSNIFSSVSTSIIVIAEARAARLGTPGAAPSTALTDLLLGEQCPNGGFSSDIPVKSPCVADPDATGYAVMALQALGGHDAEIARAAGYLVKTRGANGAWSAQGGPNVDTTGLAAAALAIAGHDVAGSRRWLAGEQVTEGPTAGTGSTRGALKFLGAFDASSSIKGTADGVLGLVPGTSLATLDATHARPGTAVLALAPATLARHTARAGTTDRVGGTGFAARERVRATVQSADPTVLGTARADRNGTVTIAFTVPRHLSAGSHRLVLIGLTSGLGTQQSLTVRAAATAGNGPVATPTPVATPPVPTSGPVLAATGQHGRQVRGELLIGLGCVVLGALALLAGRRRPRAR